MNLVAWCVAIIFVWWSKISEYEIIQEVISYFLLVKRWKKNENLCSFCSSVDSFFLQLLQQNVGERNWQKWLIEHGWFKTLNKSLLVLVSLPSIVLLKVKKKKKSEAIPNLYFVY